MIWGGWWDILAYPDFILKYFLIKNALSNLIWEQSQSPARNCELEVNGIPIHRCNKRTSEMWLRTDEGESINKDKETLWSQKFNTEIDWPYTWSLLFRLRLDTKCTELHWKIIHNIYPTKVLLQKMKIKDNNICEHCNQVDTIEHFFVQCRIVKPLWAYS